MRHGVRNIYTITEQKTSALVLGVVKGKEKDTFTLTQAAENVNSLSGGKLIEKLTGLGRVIGPGDVRYIGKVHSDLAPHVIVVGVDSEQGDAEENI